MQQTRILRKYVKLLSQWTWLFVCAGAIAGIVTYTLSIQQTPIYRASTKLLIDETASTNPGSVYEGILSSERRASTYAELLRAGPLLDSVIQKLHLSIDVEHLRQAINVVASRDSQVVSVEVENTDPHTASMIANTLVDGFNEQTQKLQDSRFAQLESSFRDQTDALEKQIQENSNALSSIGSAPQDTERRRQLEISAEQYRQRYNDLTQVYEQIHLGAIQSRSAIVQIEPASVPQKSVAPHVFRNTLLMTIFGILIAIGLVFIRDMLDDSISDAEQLSQIFSVPVIGLIGNRRGAGKSKPIIFESPQSAIAEEFRMLRTNLRYMSINHAMRTLLISSASPNEGKSFVSVNLAATLAEDGSEVILIDADLRRPTLHTYMGLPNRSGLSDLFLSDSADPKSVVQDTSFSGLGVATAGKIPPNPAELVGSERMTNIMSGMQASANFVIVDTPPAIPVTDALLLARHADGVLLVVRAGESRLSLVKQTLEQFERIGVHIVGIVLNDIPDHVNSSHRIYYMTHAIAQPKVKRRWFGSKAFFSHDNVL